MRQTRKRAERRRLRTQTATDVETVMQMRDSLLGVNSTQHKTIMYGMSVDMRENKEN